jgi:hypothetical protein
MFPVTALVLKKTTISRPQAPRETVLRLLTLRHVLRSSVIHETHDAARQ